MPARTSGAGVAYSDGSTIGEALRALLGPEAGLDADGRVRLDFRGDVTLVLECPAGAEVAFLHAAVLRSDAAEHLRSALSWNLFGLPLPGAWLALDAPERTILLCRTVPRRCDAVQLDTVLAEHLGAVATLRERFAAASGEPEAAQPFAPESYTFRL